MSRARYELVNEGSGRAATAGLRGRGRPDAASINGRFRVFPNRTRPGNFCSHPENRTRVISAASIDTALMTLTVAVRGCYWLPLPPLPPVPVVPRPVPLVFMLPVEFFGSAMPVG
jgi:hypothetical protein